MTKKMTTLDALSTLDVDSAVLTIRADYWETVAERHYRAHRDEQADRLMDAAERMRAEAKKMLRAEKETAKAAKIAAAAPVATKKSRKTVPSNGAAA